MIHTQHSFPILYHKDFELKIYSTRLTITTFLVHQAAAALCLACGERNMPSRVKKLEKRQSFWGTVRCTNIGPPTTKVSLVRAADFHQSRMLLDA